VVEAIVGLRDAYFGAPRAVDEEVDVLCTNPCL
jgi:hypothetical protein